MSILALEYSVPIFLSVCAILQLAAVRNNLRGLLFFKLRGLTIAICTLVLIASAAFFFTWNYFNAIGVIEGSQQAEFFALSGTLGLLFSLLISSAINRSLQPSGNPLRSGFQALENATFIQLLWSFRDKAVK
jgi:hypothetical protein